MPVSGLYMYVMITKRRVKEYFCVCLSGWTTSHLAEEHGELGPAGLRAEVLVLASKLSFNQLLGGGGTEGAHTAVLPPKLFQVQVIQQLTAWGERRRNASVYERKPIQMSPDTI